MTLEIGIQTMRDGLMMKTNTRGGKMMKSGKEIWVLKLLTFLKRALEKTSIGTQAIGSMREDYRLKMMKIMKVMKMRVMMMKNMKEILVLKLWTFQARVLAKMNTWTQATGNMREILDLKLWTFQVKVLEKMSIGTLETGSMREIETCLPLKGKQLVLLW